MVPVYPDRGLVLRNRFTISLPEAPIACYGLGRYLNLA
ncbi:hypothetical protein D1BOALGB6SA_1222 [Olavius sp. associated proteobacterium Delta 1]|nr:hypothetical protein D1BOALGB6SA_1222 [Olavius sp. associated proteobacterium Delta 1]